MADIFCIIERTGPLREPTQPISLSPPLAWNNAQAHALRYNVTNDDGTVADLTGIGVTGNFTVYGHDTVSPLSGTITGNTAQIILPASCYAYPGRFTCHVNLTKSGQTRTVLWVEGRISKKQTATIIDPGTPVTNIETAIGNANAAATSATNAASAANSAATAANTAASHAVRYDEAQTLTDSQKAQARANIDAGAGLVSYSTSQNLTASQKQQARTNIDAGAGLVSYSVSQSLTSSQKLQARQNIDAGEGLVSYAASQTLTTAQKQQVHANIGLEFATVAETKTYLGIA